MVDHLEQLACALHRAGGDHDALNRLLELAAVATRQAAALDALRREPREPRPEPPAAELERMRLAA
jgi:hypothetical protein